MEKCGWVDGLAVGTTSYVGQPDQMSEALDSNLKFTESGTGDWWLASGEDDEYYCEADSAQATASEGEEAWLQAIVDSPNSETLKFHWKVSSESDDYLKFYIDDQEQAGISGEVDWQPSTNLLALIREARYAGRILSAAPAPLSDPTKLVLGGCFVEVANRQASIFWRWPKADGFAVSIRRRGWP